MFLGFFFKDVLRKYNNTFVLTCSGFFLVLTNSSLFGIVPPSQPIVHSAITSQMQMTRTTKQHGVKTLYCFETFPLVFSNFSDFEEKKLKLSQ